VSVERTADRYGRRALDWRQASEVASERVESSSGQHKSIFQSGELSCSHLSDYTHHICELQRLGEGGWRGKEVRSERRGRAG
jgi:hypothetical protein